MPDAVTIPLHFRAHGYRVAGAGRAGTRCDRPVSLVDIYPTLIDLCGLTPKGGQRWVAFTYGPWALAQKIKKGAAVAQPFAGKDVPSKAASEWLEPHPTQERAVPGFRIKSTKILLEPFYSAGDRKSGPRTYFKF